MFFERMRIWRQIRLVLIQTRSVGMYIFIHSDRPQTATAGRKKINKASKPRYRQGKAEKKADKASVLRKLCPQILILILSERQGRGTGRVAEQYFNPLAG